MEGPVTRQADWVVRPTALAEGWFFVAAMSIRHSFGASYLDPSTRLDVAPAECRNRTVGGILQRPTA